MPQSLAAVYIHLVFSTKNRKPFLATPVMQKKTFAQLAVISANLDCPALLVGGQPDHIHLLGRLGRTISQAEWAKEVKRVSSIWVGEQGAAYADFAWQAGYGTFSVSHSNLNAVKKYILDQDNHHKKITFQDEYRALLKKHQIEYDERYVWD